MKERRARASAWQSVTTHPFLSIRSRPVHLLPVAHASAWNDEEITLPSLLFGREICNTIPESTVHSFFGTFRWQDVDDLNQSSTHAATQSETFSFVSMTVECSTSHNNRASSASFPFEWTAQTRDMTLYSAQKDVKSSQIAKLNAGSFASMSWYVGKPCHCQNLPAMLLYNIKKRRLCPHMTITEIYRAGLEVNRTPAQQSVLLGSISHVV